MFTGLKFAKSKQFQKKSKICEMRISQSSKCSQIAVSKTENSHREQSFHALDQISRVRSLS